MEEKNKCNGFNSLFLIIFLILLLLVGLGGYYFGAKQYNDLSVEARFGKTEIISTPETNTEISNDTDTIVEKQGEMTADEKYKVFINGLKNNLKTTINSFDENVEFVTGINPSIRGYDGIEYIILKDNGDMYVRLNKDSDLGKKYGTNYKIASNVVKCGITPDGLDGDYIYLIKDDGKFYYFGANSQSDKRIEFKEATKLKNIVSVDVERIYSDAAENLASSYAIDIEGNIYRFNEFINN